MQQPRIPSNLAETRSFPVVQIGEIPAFDLNTWDLTISGMVEKPLRYNWNEFRALPRVVRDCDFYCILGFARLDNRFEGVLLRDVLGRAIIKTGARFVRFSDGQQYDTTIPLDWAVESDVMLADTHDGRALAPEHGSPIRIIVPGRNGWKQCKWVRLVELLEKDKLGFWESRGKSNDADPFELNDAKKTTKSSKS